MGLVWVLVLINCINKCNFAELYLRVVKIRCIFADYGRKGVDGDDPDSAEAEGFDGG